MTPVAARDRRHPQRAPRARGRAARAQLRAPTSAPRCSPSCASAPSPPPRASTPTTSGRTCGSPRARPPSRCGWPRSWATGSGSASPVRTLKVGAGGCSVQLDSGEIVSGAAVVSAVPAGPLRDIAVEGVSDARLESLHRQRHALAAKFVAAYPRPFWRDRGQNGLTESEGVLGSSWPQSEGILSCLVPPERIAAYLSTDQRLPPRGGARRAGRLVRPRRADAGGHLRAAVGHRPVDAGLRHPVAARRRAAASARCTAPTSRRSTCAAPTSGWPATWRARCAPAAAAAAAALARG